MLATDLPQDHAIARVEAADAISFAQMHQKFHYDRKHQPMYFKKGDKVLLRLHKGYSIPQPADATKADKLEQRYVGPFDVVAKVDKQAYRLDIPGHWRVHPVFSVAQLEPWPAGKDPFDRPLPDQPDSVFVEGDTDEYKSYEIDRLLNKRVRRRGKGYSTDYLLRWQGYGPEHDQWYNVKHLEDAPRLIDDYENAMQAREDLLLPKGSQSPQQPQLPKASLPPLPQQLPKASYSPQPLPQPPTQPPPELPKASGTRALLLPPPPSTDRAIAVVVPK